MNAIIANPTVCFRRVSTDACGSIAYSDTVTVTEDLTLDPGQLFWQDYIDATSSPVTISATHDTICLGGTPLQIGESIPASGGQTPYDYQWQFIANYSGSAQNIAGATSVTFDPGVYFPQLSSFPGNYTFRRAVTSCGSTYFSRWDTLTVLSAFQVNIAPLSQSFCGSGNPAAMTVIATGAYGYYSYQWYYVDGDVCPDDVTGILIPGATAATYTPPAGLTVTRSYAAKVDALVPPTQPTPPQVPDCGVPTWTNCITVVVNSAPSITAQPQDATACTSGGGDANFTVSASGGGLSYQWQVCTGSCGNPANFTNITAAGANPTYANWTTPTLNLTGAVGANNNWEYQCVVSGACVPSATSTPAVLTVNAVDPSSAGGSVTSNQTICTGSQPSSDLTLGGYTGSIVEWQSSADAAFTSPTVIANTTATLTAASIGALTATTYFRALVQNGACSSSYSSPASVTVNTTTVGGMVSASQSICSGATLLSDLTLSGKTGNVVKWQYSTVAPYTSPTDIVNSTTLLTAGSIGALTATTYFWAVVKSGVCVSLNSDYVIISVTQPSVGGVVSSDQTICNGAAVADLTLSGYTGIITEWQQSANNSFSPYTSITDPTPILPGATIGTLASTTYFRAAVQNGNGECPSVNSGYIKVTVIPASVGGTVSSAQTICSGSAPAVISLDAGSYTGSIVKWQKSPDAANWTDIAITNTFLVPGNMLPLFSSTTYFRAVLQSGGCAPANSASVVITVTSASVGGSVSSDQTICSGNQPSSNFFLSGNTGTVVKWQQSANNSFAPATDIPNTTTTLTPAEIGALTATTYIRAVVQYGTCSTANSAYITITVSPGPPAQPGAIVGINPVCSGTTNDYWITLVSGATGYTWSLPTGWTGTSSTTATIAQISATVGSVSGNVSVTADNPCGSSPPRTIAVTVNSSPAQPVFSGGLGDNPNIICHGDIKWYVVASSSDPTVTYSWSLPPGWSGSSTTHSINVTAGDSAVTGDVTVYAINSCGSSTAATFHVTVPAAPNAGTVTGITPICSGSTTTVSTNGYTATTWQWQFSTDNVTYNNVTGGNPNNGTGDTWISGPLALPGSFRVCVTNVCPAPSVCSGLFAVAFSGSISRWNGSQSRDWMDYRNWSCLGIPTTREDVIIPSQSSVPNQPEIKANAIGVCKTISLQQVPVTDFYELKIDDDLGGELCVDFQGKGECSPVTAGGVVTDAFGLQVMSPVTICNGGSIQLTSDGGDNSGYIPNPYTWSPAAGLSNVNIYNPVATPAVTTTYTVTVIDGAGTQTKTVVVQVTQTPATPGDPSGTNPQCTSIDVNWPPLSPAPEHYEVVVDDDPLFGSPDFSTTTIPGSSTSVTATGLVTGTLYYFYVAGINNSCGFTGPASSVQGFSTLPSVANATLTANVGSGQTCSSLTANWSSVADASGYYLDVSTQDNPNFDANILPSYNYLDVLNVTSYNVTGLTAGTTYYYKVRAYNSCSVSLAYSNIKSCSTTTGVTSPSNVTYCLGGPAISFTVSGGVTYQWQVCTTCPGTPNWSNITVAGANPTYSNYTTGTLGLSGITTTASNGYLYKCVTACGTSGAATLTVGALPAANAGSNASICSGGSAVIGAPSTAGHTYSWTPTTGLDDATSSQPTASPASSHTYTLTETITATGCSNTGTVTVTVNPNLPVSVTIADGGITTICSGQSLTFTATPTNGGSAPAYQWKKNNVAISGATSSTYTSTTIANGDAISCILTNTTDACITNNPATSSNINITVYNPLSGGTVASSQTICTGSTPAAFTNTASATGGNSSWSYQWQSSSDNVTFANIGSATATTYAPPALTATTYYKRNATEATCGAAPSSNTLTVTVNANPTVSNAGSNAAQCNNGSFTLGANVPAVGTGAWTCTGGCTGVSITTPSANNSTVTGVATGTPATLSWTISNGVCPSSASSVTLTNDPAVTVSNAGANQAQCNNGSFTLAGNAPTTGTGLWTCTSGCTGVTITTPASNTSTVTGVPTGTPAVLKWTITGGTCSSNSSVTLTNDAAVTVANAGPSQSQCNNGSFMLAGNSPTTGVGTWTCTGGCTGVTITTPGSNTSTVTGVATGTPAALTWTIVNGSCSSASTVTLSNNPNLAASVSISSNVGNTICSGSSVTITATPTNGGGAPNYNFKVNGASVQNGAGATYTTTTLNNNDAITCVLTSNATCATGNPATSNTITMTVKSLSADPTSASASPAAFCAGTSNTTLSVNGGSLGTNAAWTWHSGGVCGGASIGTGATLPVTLSATTTYSVRAEGDCNNSACVGVTVTIYAAFAAGTVAANQNICNGATPASFTQTSPTGGDGTYTYQWQSSSDNTTFTNIGGATSSTYAPGSLTVTTYYRRTDVSGSSCGSAHTNTVTVTVYPVLAAGTIGSAQTICSGITPSGLTQATAPTGGDGTYTYQWQSSSDNITFTNIGGATSSTYSPGSLTATTYYRRKDTSGSGCGTVNTNTVTVTVNPILPVSVSIAANHNPACNGVSVTFTATPTNGGSSPIYNWKKNGTGTGVSTATYTPASIANGDVITCILTNNDAGACLSGNPATSNAITMTVYTALAAGTVAADQTIASGATPAGLTQTAAPTGGDGTYTYQ